MNRRNFLASAIAAALVPKALVELPYVARYTHQTYGLGFAIMDDDTILTSADPDYAAIGERYARALRASFKETMEASLRDLFEKEYAKTETNWSLIFNEQT